MEIKAGTSGLYCTGARKSGGAGARRRGSSVTNAFWKGCARHTRVPATTTRSGIHFANFLRTLSFFRVTRNSSGLRFPPRFFILYELLPPLSQARVGLYVSQLLARPYVCMFGYSCRSSIELQIFSLRISF